MLYTIIQHGFISPKPTRPPSYRYETASRHKIFIVVLCFHLTFLKVKMTYLKPSVAEVNGNNIDFLHSLDGRLQPLVAPLYLLGS